MLLSFKQEFVFFFHPKFILQQRRFAELQLNIDFASVLFSPLSFVFVKLDIVCYCTAA